MVSSHPAIPTTTATQPTWERDQPTPSWLVTKVQVVKDRGNRCLTGLGLRDPLTTPHQGSTATIHPIRATSRTTTRPPKVNLFHDLPMKGDPTHRHI